MEVEKRIREKQYGNPHFAFLYGGEHSEYYRYRLMQEIQSCMFSATFLLDFMTFSMFEVVF